MELTLWTKSSNPTQLQWLKDGSRITETTLTNATVSHIEAALVLNIKCISITHAGNYTCSAQNAYGKDEFTASLVITSAPFWLENAYSEGNELGVLLGDSFHYLPLSIALAAKSGVYF
ncbi:hemicentin-2-like [Tropilaelaps mercedesae]|uniref:Hemicentin-2-like n=1 Tax=Tropilaelaps mercedesae TaxID=418985 RepID=A0A1V9X4X4_9ACAR|nr:hemicentin-2-like [Tropilaelaps mercedesae]